MEYVRSDAVPRVEEPAVAWTSAPKARILVVDDDTAVRSIAAEILRDAGYAVQEAGSGEEALALVLTGRAIDLLLTDMDMPGMSGGALAATLRSRWPALKVLVLTGRHPDDLKHRIPADARIVGKPFKVLGLLDEVRKALG